MAVRRKRVDAEAASLDSLMDALTNVVAVLIFVLLLVNCEVSQKVVKMMEDIVPVTEEDMQKVREMLKSLDLEKKQLEELRKQPPPTQIDIDQLQKRFEELKAKISAQQSLIDQNNRAASELQKLHDQLQLERDDAKKVTEARMAEIERLETLLDTTPVAKEIPPTEIKIPEVKVIPEDSTIYYAHVNGDRVHLVDVNAVNELIRKQFAAKKKDLLPDAKSKEEKKEDSKERKERTDRSSGRDKTKEEIILYDREKVLAFLRGLDFKLPPGQSIHFNNHPWQKGIEMSIHAGGAGGSTIEELDKPGNAFASALSRLRPPKDVVVFVVEDRSMLLYAKARKLVDSRNIPCGWELVSDKQRNHFYQAVPDIFVQPIQEAPKPTPTPPGWKPPERARSVGPSLG